MRFRPVLLIVALVALSVVTRLPAGAQTPTVVQVGPGTVYNPQDIHVSPGATVTWVVRNDGHSVTEDHCNTAGTNPECRFDFPGGQNSLSAGESRSYTAPNQDITITYHCRFHGSVGMVGSIVVGAGSPTPTPAPTPTPVPQFSIDVPAQYATIQAAVNAAPPGAAINVAPGTYAAFKVAKSKLTIRKAPNTTGDVTIEGGGAAVAGIAVTGDDIDLEGLRIHGFRASGVTWTGVTGFTASDLVSDGNTPDGFAATGVMSGVIERSTATGATGAGFTVAGCQDCDTVLRDVTANANHVGYLGSNAGGVIVRDSTFGLNAEGIVLRSRVADTATVQQGTHVIGNTVAGDGPVPAAPEVFPLPAPQGIGIWVQGGWFDVIESNTVSSQSKYGIAVTLSPALSVANQDRVIGNTLSGNGIDLAYDGFGLGVCFGANTAAATTEPPVLAAVSTYGSALPVGLPDPLVDAGLVT